MGLRGSGRWCLLTGVGWMLVASGSAWADCSRGTRPPTIPERTFQVETLTAIKAAMPAAPVGWRVVEETEIRPPRLACIGQELRPLTLDYQIHLRRVAPGAREAGSADGGPEDDSSGEAAILVEVNARDRAIQNPADALALDGTALAFRRTSGTASTIDLMLGDWSLEPDSDRPSEREAHAHLVTDVPYTKVQTLLIRVTGAVPGAEALARRIKLDALKQLLYR